MARAIGVAQLPLMPIYNLRIVNEHFVQSAELEAGDVATGWKKAIAAAITIASDTVSPDSPFFAAKMTLSEGDRSIGEYVVSVGAQPLKDQGD